MGVPNQFAAKTIIESIKVNQNFAVACFSGEILMHGGDVAPNGWLFCDGSSYLRSSYPDLFAVIGTKYGSADGTHFNVPNLNGRVPAGKDSAQTEFDTLGKTGGAKTHTLALTEIPSHNHGGVTGTDSPDHAHYDSGHQHPCTIDPGTDSSPPGNFRSDSGGAYTKWTNVGYANIGGASARHSHSVTAQGGGGSHNNLQPYLALNFVIKT